MAVAHREAEEKRKLKMENMRVLLKTFEEPESNWTEAQLDKMTEEELQKMLSSKKSKQRSEEKRRRREQSKRLDIIIRAIREVEQQRVTSTAPALYEADAAYVAQRTAEEEAKEYAKFEARLKYQPDLLRIKPYMSDFEASVIKRRRAATEKQLVCARHTAVLEFHAHIHACHSRSSQDRATALHALHAARCGLCVRARPASLTATLSIVTKERILRCRFCPRHRNIGTAVWAILCPFHTHIEDV